MDLEWDIMEDEIIEIKTDSGLVIDQIFIEDLIDGYLAKKELEIDGYRVCLDDYCVVFYKNGDYLDVVDFEDMLIKLGLI